MADVFVSYSRRDADFVAGLAEALRDRGKDVWVDVEGIRDAEVFPAALRRAIEASDAFLFVISPDSVQSAFCEQEVGHAAELNKRIVPVALRPVLDEQIPGEIRFRNWIPVDGSGEPHALADRLVAAIDTDLDWERRHTQVTMQALRWDEGGRDESMLLRGSELAVGERWLAAGAGKDPGPTALEQEYLLAGRQAAARRQRTLVGAVSAMLFVAVGLLIFALISRGNAVSAEASANAGRLAALSEDQQSVDPERAVLLAMDAVRQRVSYGTPDGTMFALRAALDASPIRYRLPAVGSQAGCGGPGVAYDPAPGTDLIVEGLCDGTLVFANAASGHVERRVRLRGEPAANLAFTPGGSALVVATNNRFEALDPLTGAILRRSSTTAPLGALAADPQAPVVAATSSKGILFWNADTGRLTVATPRGMVRNDGDSLAFSPDGRDLAVNQGQAAWNSSPPKQGLLVYDIATRRVVATSGILAVVAAFSPDGTRLAIGTYPGYSGVGRILMLNVRTLVSSRGFVPFAVDGVMPSALAFSPDGRSLAYGFFDGNAGLMSAATGSRTLSYPGDTAAIADVSFSRDGDLVATASVDGEVRAWSTGGLTAASYRTGTDATLTAAPGGVAAMSWPGLGPRAGVVVQRWLAHGAAAAPLVLSPTPQVWALFLAPGGRFAGIIDSHQILRLWNLEARRLVRTFRVSPPPNGEQPSLSADGRYLAMNITPQTRAAAPPRPKLIVLDLATGRERVLHTSARFAGCSTNNSWNGFAFSANDRYLAAGTFCGEVGIWNLSTGQEIGRPLDLGGELASIAIRPDGKQLAAASWDGIVTVLPVPYIGRGATRLTENEEGVAEVAYSPNGRYLATAGLDSTVRIFDAHTLAELRVIDAPTPLVSIAFTADSREVAAATYDRVIRLWDACPDCENPRALLTLARSRVTRRLTAQERAEFGLG